MCAMSMISNGKSFTIHVDTQHLLTNKALLVIKRWKRIAHKRGKL